MQFIEKIHNWTMLEPTKYGWFHIIFLLLTIVVTTLLIIYFRDCKEKTMKKIVLFTWIGLVFFGILKELIVSYNGETLKYNWGSFPFQFCETPLYIYPILILNKNKKFQNILITYLATFAFFAGLVIMINPVTVFTSSIFFNIRTMVQHGSQVVLGLFLFSWNRKNASLKNFLYSSIIFLVVVLVAISINSTVGYVVNDEVNMFYLSSRYNSVIWFVKDIQPYVPWIIFVLSYVVGFSACALATYYVEVGVYKLATRIQPNDEKELDYKN